MSLEKASSDEVAPTLKSSTSCKVRRNSRKVNWTANSEQETFRTVVVNYHYKVNKSRRNMSTTQKKRDAWNKMLAAVSAKRRAAEASDEDIPNLTTLYELPQAELAESCATEAEHSSTASSHERRDIEVEPYNLPSQQQAQTEERCVGTAWVRAVPSIEVIVISDTEEEQPAAPAKARAQTKQIQTESVRPKLRTRATAMRSATSHETLLRMDQYRHNNQLPLVSSDTSQKIKIKMQAQNTFKQRQLELHRHRIAVELKRLELLEVKLARERDEMLREQILFEKDLELKRAQLKELLVDKDDMQ